MKIFTFLTYVLLCITVSAQKVGINTNTPQQMLDIKNGRLRFTADPSPGFIPQGIEFTTSDGSQVNGFFGNYNDTILGMFGFRGAGWRYFFNTQNGNIGVEGMSNPRVPLSFNTILGKKISLYRGGTGEAGFGVFPNELRVYSDYASADLTFGYDNYTNGFTERFRVSNGGVSVTPVANSENGLVINRSRLRFKGNLLNTNAHGIIYTNNAGTLDRAFLGMLNDNEFGFYGFGLGNWNMMFNVNTGQVRIGASKYANNHMLSVGGKIATEEVRVELQSAWPDYVFDESYELTNIEKLEQYIQKNKHLPGIPKASHLESNGVELGEMQRKMMEKIEELTLYIIDLKKEIDLLKRKSN